MGHREDLLVGAKRALYEKGYARTTARDIVALSGTNLGSIGYHYGSTEALMTAAMLAAMQEWGEVLGKALSEGDGTPAGFWRRIIESVGTDRQLWLASVEVMIQAEHNGALRDQLAAGLDAGRRGMAAIALGLPEDQIDDATARGVGSVQMALLSGIVTQWLTDPASAPTPDQIVAGVQQLSHPGA
ncbi:TetR family transcriptional regulator [Actinoplanes sp. CA-131856]